MIVAMKKATVISRRGEKQDALHKLRQLGVLHLSAIPAQVTSAQEWREKKALLEKALAVTAPAREHGQIDMPGGGLDAALAAARSILDKQEAVRILNEEAESLKKEVSRLHDWEGVSVFDLRGIQDQGYEIKFLEVPGKQVDRIPPGHNAFVVKRTRTLLWVALVLKAGSAFPSEFKLLDPPRRSAGELEELQAENQSDLNQFREELDKLGNEAGDLERAVHAVAREIELAEAAAAMGATEALTYLTGFLPNDQVERLRQSCRENSWALLLQDPVAEDDVPTMVRNPRWIALIHPVFELLGTCLLYTSPSPRD